MAATSSAKSCIPPLDLAKNGDEYKEFIQNILNKCLDKFVPQPPPLLNPTTKLPNKKKAQKPDQQTVYDDLCNHLQTSPLARTASPREIVNQVEKRFFIVQLKYTEDLTLDILIRRVDLYLIGYKGKDEKWILLKRETPGQEDQVVKWLAALPQVSVTTQTTLGESYDDLFDESTPGFKDSYNAEAETELEGVIDKKVKEKHTQLKNSKNSLEVEKDNLISLIREINDEMLKIKEGRLKRQRNAIPPLQENFLEWERLEAKLLRYKIATKMLLIRLAKEKEEIRERNQELAEELDKQEILLRVEEKNLRQVIILRRLKEKTLELNTNREALISAVHYLKNEPFGEQSAQHVLILVHMICEAVRFPTICDHIKDNYLCDSVTFTEEMADLMHMWTRGSNLITTLGRDPSFVWLGEKRLKLFQVLPYFSCIKGIDHRSLQSVRAPKVSEDSEPSVPSSLLAPAEFWEDSFEGWEEYTEE